MAASTIKTPIGTGPVGVLLNGVAVYNAYDAQTYNNQGVWHRNAGFFEAFSFDSCKGHSSPSGPPPIGPPPSGPVTPTPGLYHHHVLPECFLNANRSDAHSPLLGYALDGFPIYGPYGYTTWNDKTSGVKKLKSNYRPFAYVGGNRTVFGNTNTSIANASYYGPSTSTLYQLSTFSTNTTSLTSGAFIEDFYFDSSSSAGDLNEFNGRVQVTPEYPSGIFCYIFTDDYPYVFGPGNFYGVVASTSTKNNVSEATTVVFSYPTSVTSG